MTSGPFITLLLSNFLGLFNSSPSPTPSLNAFHLPINSSALIFSIFLPSLSPTSPSYQRIHLSSSSQKRHDKCPFAIFDLFHIKTFSHKQYAHSIKKIQEKEHTGKLWTMYPYLDQPVSGQEREVL